MRIALLGVAAALWLAPSAHAAAATRILYLSNWSGHTEVYAIDASGKAPVAKLTHWRGACPELPPPSLGGVNVTRQIAPSPDGRFIVVRCADALWFMRANGTDV